VNITDYRPAVFWLNQFSLPEDRSLAAKMLDRLRYVSSVDLASDIALQLEREIPRGEKAALYIERELQTVRNKKPIKMYKEKKLKITGRRRRGLRAVGAALAAVRSPTSRRQQVGSEGVIAQQLTQLCAKSHGRFLLQPSAEEIRAARVRHMVIVTDFIGSGNRVIRMLESLWQVRSIRSWHSGRFIRMRVLCYSGTPVGLNAVKRHRSNPSVALVMPCPTITNAFSAELSADIVDLCNRRGQFHKYPLGFGRVGALIAFEHGCPNNAPAILIEASNSHSAPWQPLFEKRSAGEIARLASTAPEAVVTLPLETLRYPTIAVASGYKDSRLERRNIILLLAALSRRHRCINELVGILQMPLWQLANAIDQAKSLGLIDQQERLTAIGRQELRVLARDDAQALASSPRTNYYPSVLRAPC
jgi:hypothetical protein